MQRIPLTTFLSMLAVLRFVSSAATAEQVAAAPFDDPGEVIQLDAEDLRLITMEVLKEHPQLSASRGVKFADGYGGYDSIGVALAKSPSTVMANVIFHPHSESRGVKQAFEAHCQRSASSKDWTCPSVEIRRYVMFDFQDFEVRVKGSLDLPAIQAVIDATRQPAAAAGLRTSQVADTALQILACSAGYIVAWGNHDGSGGVGLQATLRADGNPAEAKDWIVTELPGE